MPLIVKKNKLDNFETNLLCASHVRTDVLVKFGKSKIGYNLYELKKKNNLPKSEKKIYEKS